MSYAVTVIAGRIGRDAELRYTPSGKAVCDINVATSHWWQKDGELQEETTWYKVTLWGETAENKASQCKKGRMVLVQGRVSAEAYVNKDGDAAASLKLNADTFRFMDKAVTDNDEEETPKKYPAKPKGSSKPKPANNRGSRSKTRNEDEESDEYEEVGDIPF